MKKKKNFKPKFIDNKYIDDLYQHIEEGCLNIGLLGDYATGKSSVLYSLKEKYKNLTYIELSSINKNIYKNENETDNKDKAIEQVFIHQLHNIISDSNHLNQKLKLKQKFYKKKVLEFSLIYLTFIFIISKFTNIPNNIKNYLENSNYSHNLNLLKHPLKEIFFKDIFLDITNIIYYLFFILLPLILILIASFIIIKNIITYTSKISIGSEKINLKFNSQIKENGFITKETQLIIELLKEIEFQDRLIIIIEDIDRVENEEIFHTLHDISKIVNLDSKLNGKINFIYAIKPTLLKNTATKYFDAIVDVIPFYDRLVASNYLQELLESDNELNKKFLNNICYYISDYRDLLRIANLFLDYKYTFTEIENYEKLMAIVFLKVLYPEYLNLKPLNEEKDSLEKLLELLDKHSTFEKEISYLINNPEELEEEEVLFDEYKEEIKGYDENLWNIVDYLISRKFLDNNYSWIISMISNNFSVEDRNFITNLLDKTDRIFRDPNTFKISDKEKVIDEYIDETSLLYSIELINIDLLRYFISKKDDVEISYDAELYANNMISNIINNNKIEGELLFLNNKDIISNKKSFALNLNKENTESILILIQDHLDYNTKDIDDINQFFNLFNLITLMEKHGIEFKDINKSNRVTILDFLENVPNITRKELDSIIRVRKTLELKTKNPNIIEEEEIYNYNLYELSKESIELIFNSDKIENKKNLFDYIYKEINSGKEIEGLHDGVIKTFIEYLITDDKAINLESFKNICRDDYKVKIDNILELEEKSIDVYNYIIENLMFELNLENLETLFENNNESIKLIIEEDEVLNLILSSSDDLKEKEEMIKYIIKNYNFNQKELESIVNKLISLGIKDYDFEYFEDKDIEYLESILPIIEYDKETLDKIISLNDEELFLEFCKLNIGEVKKEEIVIENIDFFNEIIDDLTINLEDKKKLIDKFTIDEKIIIKENWKLDIVNYIIEKEFKLNYQSLEKYKNKEDYSLEKIKIILDEMFRYFNGNDESKISYIESGIQESREEVLKYVLTELEKHINFELYKEILLDHKEVIEDMYNFILEGNFSSEFKEIISFVESDRQRKDIPEKFKGNIERKILKEMLNNKNINIAEKKLVKKK